MCTNLRGITTRILRGHYSLKRTLHAAHTMRAFSETVQTFEMHAQKYVRFVFELHISAQLPHLDCLHYYCMMPDEYRLPRLIEVLLLLLVCDIGRGAGACRTQQQYVRGISSW